MTNNCATALYKYKYLCFEGITHVEDMLRNDRVWFSSPLSFTDPFDCRRVYDTRNTRENIVLRKTEFLVRTKHISLSEALQEAEQDIPRSTEDLQRWQEQQLAGHSRRAANTAILCLSAVCDNQIMWAQYARPTGICVMFRVRDISEESHVDFVAEAQPIEYADRCPLINFIRNDPTEIVRKAFLTKATPYNYEAEWRIVRYDDGPGLKAIPKGIIGAVILGVSIDAKHRERIVRACAEYEGDVEIVRASLDPHTYGLRLDYEQTV